MRAALRCLQRVPEKTVMPPDRIPVPTSIHAILGRWIVHFSLMSEDDVEPSTTRFLALIGRLSHMQQPCASLEELVMLRSFVEILLDQFEAPLPQLVANEAIQVCCWMRPYFDADGPTV